MDEGSYNNVIRTNSPFSPITPGTSGTPTYKANVNRTKTRKWVEAKVQSYDGDDWGDESYDDEPEESPPPTQPASLRQPGQSGQLSTTHSSAFMPPPRTFSQPAPANAPQAVMGPRGPSGPITSTSQNRPSPPTVATGQVPARFPPRKSSMSSIGQQGVSDTAEALASRSTSRPGSSSSSRPQLDQWADPTVQAAGISEGPGKAAPFVRPADIYRRMGEEKEKQRLSMESGRPSMDSIASRGDNASPANASRSSTEQRRRTSLDKDEGTTRSPRSILAPVAERKSEYGLDRLLASPQVEPGKGDNAGSKVKSQGVGFAQNQTEPKGEKKEDLRSLSTSPKLPDLSRLSGFGDDLFSNSLRYSIGIGSSLQPVRESQPDAKAGSQRNELNPPVQPAGQHQSSVLHGPKLQPNPGIRMPSPGENVQSGTSGTIGTHDQQLSSSRPQLPGEWVSENSVLSPEQTTNTKILPDDANAGAPADLEPTTKVKQLASTDDETRVAHGDEAAHIARNEFGSNVGLHDDVVASKVISAGPGHHPTPHSLPPLKTEDPVGPANTSRNYEIKSPLESSNTESSSFVDTSRASFDNRSDPATTPTAPLNPYRLSMPRPDFSAENTGRKSTTSTVGTASPLKESDKLREEIMKTLSPSPMNPSGSGEAITNPNPQEQGAVGRESRYLSGVYDDYLSLAEDKTLLETGRALRNESMLTARRTTELESIADAGSTPQMHTSIPEVAPLSPRRTPEPALERAKRPRRFSWEQSPESNTMGTVDVESTGEAAKEINSHSPQPTASPTEHNTKQPDGTTSDLAQPEGTGASTHEPPKPSDYSNVPVRSPTPDQPSSVSGLTDENIAADVRRSLAEEKVLIESSSHRIFEPLQMEHPALSELSDPSAAMPPTSMGTSANSTTQQPKIMAFREILNLPSPDQRTQKFDETRSQFFGMDSGLSNWLMHMKNQSEQTDTTPEGDSQQTSTAAQTQPGSVGMQQSTQQPYYQQYLNASNPNTAMGPPRRTSTGNLLAQSGPTTSGFNSGNQVGTKGKELLHAAGAFGNKGVKSGMKLFTKGKNKLRERAANDKVFF